MTPEEAAAMALSEHPSDATLERFVLGRLDRKQMAPIEAHLRRCCRCGEVAMQVPDDRLVALLRTSTTGAGAKPFLDQDAGRT
jgi:hypothetical protein